MLSQDVTLSGIVKNPEDIPIEFANVYLLDKNYSTLIQGSTTDENGRFQLRGIAKDTFFIKASYIDTESEPFLISVSDNIDTLIITLNDNQQLDEVVVENQKPRLERKVDRLVFHIENTALADGDIWDVLKRTPNLLIIDDVLTIKGSGSVGILINGRKVNIPQRDIINLLSGTSASNVESVEVITNPPAKYSAEGGMLVNIKLKKNLIAGYNGAVFNKYRQGVFARHTVGTDHYFRGSKTRFSANYSYGKNKGIDRYTDITDFLETDGDTSRWVAEQDNLRRSQQHNLSLFFDYDINEKNRISISSINLWQPQLKRQNDSKTIIGGTSGMELTSFTTTNKYEADRLNTSYYLDYVRSLKKDAELSINTHFTYFDSKRPQNIQTDFFDSNGNIIGDNDFITDSKQRINLFSGQIDYLRPLNKRIKMETGLRYADINSESSISQQGFDPGQSGVSLTENGNFKYDEAIWATYVGLNGKWDTWRVSSGLRAEYTKTVGDLDTEPQPYERDYLELFPSFSLQYIPAKKHNLKLYYYRRIKRPRYSSVNPFQVFLTNNSVAEGEPNLLPATRNYIAADYTYDKSYTIELFYRNEKNPFRSFVEQDNENQVFRVKTANFDRNINFGLDLIVSKRPLKFWDFYVLGSYQSVQYDFVDLESGRNIENRRWLFKLVNNNSFTLLSNKTLFADLDFKYYSDLPIGNTVQESFNEVNIAFRKTFCDKKASLSLGLTDIFKQGNRFWTRQYGNQNNTTLYRPESRLFTLGFRYKFGNTGIRANKKAKRVEERRRI